MNVLSLFDGISCGQLALNRVGIKYNNYYASEIDKFAIKVAQDNYPNTIQVGDITNLKGEDFNNIEILIGGSPCQGFSFAGKGLNFEDERSKLFFEFVRLKNEINPKYWLLENVNMEAKYLNVISQHLDVKPIFINSRLVSCQDRKRWYWTNIPNIAEPIDKNISFSDICNDDGFAGSMRGRRINEFGKRDDYNKSIPIVQHIESRKDNKTNCLTTVGKDNIVSKQRVGRTPLSEVEWRYLSRNEMEAIQTVPKDYTKSVSVNQALRLLGNGFTVDVISHIFSYMD